MTNGRVDKRMDRMIHCSLRLLQILSSIFPCLNHPVATGTACFPISPNPQGRAIRTPDIARHCRLQKRRLPMTMFC
jgi:hypothetical protein